MGLFNERTKDKMAIYKINYNTGAGNKKVEGDLWDAMAAADSGAAYTQEDITIEDENGRQVARRPWCGVATGVEDQEDPIQFGDFGFYADWWEL